MSAQSWIRACGWAGLLASILVGTGEFLLHFTPDGGIQDQTSYLFFNEVSEARLSAGHYIAVLSAPLYVLGYYFLSKQLEPAGRKQAKAVFVVGAYSFMIGAVWIGQRYFLGETVHAIADGNASQSLLTALSEHNEPLGECSQGRHAGGLHPLDQTYTIGQDSLPEMVGYFQPHRPSRESCGTLLCRYHAGLYLFPIAMNVTHFIVFGLALLTTRNKSIEIAS